MAAVTAYRACYAVGVTLFFASVGAGLAYGLLAEHAVPRVEREDLLPRNLEDYHELAAIKPRDPIALALLGSALMDAGENAEAVRVFERTLESKAAPLIANQRLVTLYLRQGRLEMARRQARAVYRKGGELDERTLRALGMSRGKP